jgi:hypothetical protein
VRIPAAHDSIDATSTIRVFLNSYSPLPLPLAGRPRN